jgi:hypothetical protein
MLPSAAIIRSNAIYDRTIGGCATRGQHHTGRHICKHLHHYGVGGAQDDGRLANRAGHHKLPITLEVTIVDCEIGPEITSVLKGGDQRCRG